MKENQFSKKEEHNLFYALSENILDNEIVLCGEEVHHLRNVLRKKENDIILVTDGRGNRYKVRISKINRTKIHAIVLEQTPVKRYRGIDLSLAFVPLKGLRNDFIIEKGTELGVNRFILFTSKFSVLPRLSYSKFNRFRKIMINSMLQSLQYHIPEIVFEKDVNSFMKNSSDFDIILLANKNGKSDVPAGPGKVLYIVGPEGGFDDSEIALFEGNGARLLSLGQNRLRSETAAIAGIVKIFTTYGII